MKKGTHVMLALAVWAGVFLFGSVAVYAEDAAPEAAVDTGAGIVETSPAAEVAPPVADAVLPAPAEAQPELPAPVPQEVAAPPAAEPTTEDSASADGFAAAAEADGTAESAAPLPQAAPGPDAAAAPAPEVNAAPCDAEQPLFDAEVDAAIPVQGTEVFENGHWRFLDHNGNYVTGLVHLPDDRIVYYDQNGNMQFGEATIDGMPYVLDDVNGNLLNTGEYYVPGSGWAYLNPDNAEYVKEAMYTLPDGRIVYYDKNGFMQFGERTLADGMPYYFDTEDGGLTTGEVLVPDRGWAYLDPNIAAYVAGFYQLPDSRLVYYGNDYIMRFGETTINGMPYMLDSANGNVHTGELHFDGLGWTYLNPETMTYATGLVQLPDGRFAVYGDDHTMQFGDIVVGGTPWRLDGVDGHVHTGELYFDGRGWMYLNPETMTYAVGIVHLADDRLVYYGRDGVMDFGWISDVDTQAHYYADLGNGSFYRGWHIFDDGYYRYFYPETGKLATDTWIYSEGSWLYAELGGIYIGTNTNVDPQLAYEVLALVNGKRVNAGLAPLAMDRGLLGLAMERAQELTVSYAHTRPDGRNYDTILQDRYYHFYWDWVGENIAKNLTTPAAVVNAWMNSSDTRENIMNPNYTHIAVGVYQKPETGQLHWVLLSGIRNTRYQYYY